MIHGNFVAYAETTATDPFVLQNRKLLKVHLHYGPVKALLGSMVAYQGDARFEHAGSGGMKKFLKSKLTGEGGAHRTDVTFTAGEVFLADQARDIEVIYLDNDMISVNGANVLAFSASITHDIERVGGGMAGAMTGGLYNTTLRGSGYVAVTSDGQPMAFDVAAAPVFADFNAVVCWTNGVQMQVKADMGFKSLRSGEAIQCGFTGQGWVLIQPSENVPLGGGGTGNAGGSGGLLGGLTG